MKKDFIIRLLLVICLGLLVFQFGIRPILSKEYYIKSFRLHSWAKDNLSKDKDVYDVIVIGEEPEGIAAAVSAARLGARTLIIAEGHNLWEAYTSRLNMSFEPNRNARGELLNKGIFSELHSKLGDNFSVDKYRDVVSKLVGNEQKNLEVVCNAVVESPLMQDNKVTGLNVSVGGKKVIYNGKRLIDATRDGMVLEMCKVPYFVGSQDINMEKSFMPVRLNFEMEGIEWNHIKELVQPQNSQFHSEVAKYRPTNINSRIGKLTIVDQGNGRILIMGLGIANIDVSNEKTLSNAYDEGVKEAKELAAFLSERFSDFKGSKFSRAAEKLYIPEYRHFNGEYLLSVNDLIENKDFETRIALGSKAVDAGKFVQGSSYYVGKPVQYSIPLGCIIPLKVENILMVGSKASYSSLASTSAGNPSTSISTGEAAGAIAVYSITKSMTPREVEENKDEEMKEELQRILKRQGMLLPQFNIENRNVNNWSYPAVRQLNALGLIAGGLYNNYYFDTAASQENIALLLLNGIYRLSDDKYTLELDSTLRAYFIKEGLTKDKAAEIFIRLHTGKLDKQNAYEKACKAGYINDMMQLRLKDKQVLTMDDVYYLSVYNIKLYTKKDIKD